MTTEELIEQCRTYRGTTKPCFNEDCKMKDDCLSYFGECLKCIEENKIDGLTIEKRRIP